MSDLRRQIREHYDAKAIPADQAEVILARGRAAAAGEKAREVKRVAVFPASRARPWRRILSLAAALLVLAGLAGWWGRRETSRVSFAAVAPRVIEFFGSSPELAHAPKDKAALRDWLLARGAPPDFHIPASLLPLESFACSVVDVHGQKTFLSCYWREDKPDRGDHELIHLLVARRSDFRDAPSSAQPQRRQLDGWSFASWSEGDVVYTLATAAPPEKLTPFLARAGSLQTLAQAYGARRANAALATQLGLLPASVLLGDLIWRGGHREFLGDMKFDDLLKLRRRLRRIGWIKNTDQVSNDLHRSEDQSPGKAPPTDQQRNPQIA